MWASFLLYGALLGPGISALFGVTGLASMGFLPWESYIYVLATWWTGDSIGVLILAPALLMWATRRGALELGTEFALFAVALVLASLLCLGVLPGYRECPAHHLSDPATADLGCVSA